VGWGYATECLEGVRTRGIRGPGGKVSVFSELEAHRKRRKKRETEAGEGKAMDEFERGVQADGASLPFRVQLALQYPLQGCASDRQVQTAVLVVKREVPEKKKKKNK